MKYRIGLNVKNVRFGEKQKSISNKMNISTVKILADFVLKNKK